MAGPEGTAGTGCVFLGWHAWPRSGCSQAEGPARWAWGGLAQRALAGGWSGCLGVGGPGGLLLLVGCPSPQMRLGRRRTHSRWRLQGQGGRTGAASPPPAHLVCSCVLPRHTSSSFCSAHSWRLLRSSAQVASSRCFSVSRAATFPLSSSTAASRALFSLGAGHGGGEPGDPLWAQRVGKAGWVLGCGGLSGQELRKAWAGRRKMRPPGWPQRWEAPSQLVPLRRPCGSP